MDSQSNCKAEPSVANNAEKANENKPRADDRKLDEKIVEQDILIEPSDRSFGNPNFAVAEDIAVVEEIYLSGAG